MEGVKEMITGLITLKNVTEHAKEVSNIVNLLQWFYAFIQAIIFVDLSLYLVSVRPTFQVISTM